MGQAREHLPDLVFCDIMMPQMNGPGLLAALQSEAALKHILLVFLSANAQPEKLDDALRLGANGYVAKPFNFARLQAISTQHLE